MEEKEMDEYYWDVINVLSKALSQQMKSGKYDESALVEVVDALDLECDRRIVFSEPTDEVTALREILADFIDEQE